ncbi:MAG TPA: lysophospholipid acyltransferase family protein [Streptosporangiales bacterium]
MRTTLGAVVRKLCWRLVFTLTGGLAVDGSLPPGGCVLVANHSSHADAPALLAALPTRRRPRVAAAADYWFTSRTRSRFARWVVGAFGVARDGGGYGQLIVAGGRLRAGDAVVVFPEGTRTRDGALGRFHSGAGRLARAAGVPIVPVTVVGTRRMLPVHGAFRRGPVSVRIGTPVDSLDAARTAIESTLAERPRRPDSTLRRRVALVATSRGGLALVVAWAVAEAISWPLLPELLLAALVAAAPRRGVRLTLAAAVASIAGGLLCWQLGAAGMRPPEPFTTPAMHAAATRQVAAEGAAAMRHQPLSGTPYKVYAIAAGRAHVDPLAFAAWSLATRDGRIVVVGLAVSGLARLGRRLRRFYTPYLLGLGAGFGLGLATVVSSWS